MVTCPVQDRTQSNCVGSTLRYGIAQYSPGLWLNGFTQATTRFPVLKQFDSVDRRINENWLINDFVTLRLSWHKHPDRRKITYKESAKGKRARG